MPQVGEPQASTFQLASLIRKHLEELVAEWEALVLARPLSGRTAKRVLSPQLPRLLLRLADTLQPASPPSVPERVREKPAASIELADAIAELSSLREAVLAVWARHHGPLLPVQELGELDRTLDEWMHGMVAAAIERGAPLEPVSTQAATLHTSPSEYAELEQSLSLLEAVLSDSSMGFVVVDRNLRCIRMNAPLAALRGMTKEDAIGERLIDLYPDYAGKLELLYRHVFETGKPLLRLEFVGTSPHLGDHAEKRMHASYYPVKDAAGKTVLVAAVLADVTDRSELERTQAILVDAGALLSQSLKLTTTLRSLAQIAITHLSDDCVIDLCDEDGRFYQSEVMSRDPERLEWIRPHVTPPFGSPLWTLFHKALENDRIQVLSSPAVEELTRAVVGDSWDPESFHRFRARSLVAFPLRARGRKLGVMTLASVRKGELERPEVIRLARALADRAAVAIDNAKLFEDVQQGMRAREHIVAIVSHDLRNPLNAISLSAARLLQHAELGEPAQKLAKRIHAAATRASKLIHDLLDMTQVRRGEFPVHRQEVELEPVLRQVVDEARLHSPGRVVELENQCTCRGDWDPDRLAQLVSNLVGNALQHGAQDQPVKVRACCDGTNLKLEVWNQGRPIPDHLLPVMFEPFSRGNGERTGGSKSVGLGLYIAREIAAAHGGDITVQSDAEHGTTFRVLLPLRGMSPPR